MLDYKKLGFRCGIEIHQELSTDKLFCGCSSGLTEKNEIVNISRKLRAVAGESDETDRAALYEMLRDRIFNYAGYEGEVCLVDTDSEPPHQVNKDALEIALGVAKLFKLKVPGTICVMRKTVTDGSAISGFQRTMLVGIEGKDSWMATSRGKVKITQLNLEEDSCKIIEKSDKAVKYSLSRLGIPLLEIGTDASICDPEHAKEVALRIGTALRSFDHMKRGLGTIRQDVNVSIKGGSRTEIKGWQDLRMIPLLVENEVKRQLALQEIMSELKKRRLKPFEKRIIDVTQTLSSTSSKVFSAGLKSGGKAYALLLPKFRGLLRRELCPGKTFGRELSEYAKAFGTKGMIHSDEDLKRYGLEQEFTSIAGLFGATVDDLIVVVVEREEVAKKALHSVYDRAKISLEGVPEETRIPNHGDATSSYARPLPGANRLYPETDIPNICVSKAHLGSIILPEPIEKKKERYVKDFGISSDLAREIIDEGYDFDKIVKQYSLTPGFIAEALINYPKEIRKRYGKDVILDEHVWDLFGLVDRKEIPKDAVFEILAEYAAGKSVDIAKYKTLPDGEIEKIVIEVISNNKGAPQNAIIGKVMEKLRGKAAGQKIVQIIRKNFK